MYTERDFLEMMLYRNSECNKQLELTGVYKSKSCLAQHFISPVFTPFDKQITQCIGDSFANDEDFESDNRLLA